MLPLQYCKLIREEKERAEEYHNGAKQQMRILFSLHILALFYTL